MPPTPTPSHPQHGKDGKQDHNKSDAALNKEHKSGEADKRNETSPSTASKSVSEALGEPEAKKAEVERAAHVNAPSINTGGIKK